MPEGKIKASKTKVHQPPEGTTGLDGKFHVYIYDVYNKTFLPGEAFETIERATSFMRHEQERIYVEQEADPEFFDLPFVSADSDLIERVGRDDDYKAKLMKSLDHDARARARKR